MSKVVFILGAGASYSSGAPMMGDFLDKAQDLYWTGCCRDKRDSFELVFRALRELQIVHHKANLDLRNLESVLGAFEMSELLGNLGKLADDEISQLRGAMDDVIFETLMQRVNFGLLDDRRYQGVGHIEIPFRRIVPAFAYWAFAQELKQKLYDNSRKDLSFSIITFNYDLCLDYVLPSEGMRIEYGLDEPEERKHVKLYKLHGSLNWFREKDHISSWPVHATLAPISLPPNLGGDSISLANVSEVPSDKRPVIVPPSWSKVQYYRQLGNLWSAAARELRDAEQIYVLGYSLPETDQFFRYLFGLGSIGDGRIRRFWVYDPDTTGQVEARFRNLVGQGVGSFRHIRAKFENAGWIQKLPFETGEASEFEYLASYGAT